MEEIKFIETLITMSDDTQNYWYGPRTRLTPHQDLQPQTLTLYLSPCAENLHLPALHGPFRSDEGSSSAPSGNPRRCQKFPAKLIIPCWPRGLRAASFQRDKIVDVQRRRPRSVGRARPEQVGPLLNSPGKTSRPDRSYCKHTVKPESTLTNTHHY
jgi:hypothetical protein